MWTLLAIATTTLSIINLIHHHHHHHHSLPSSPSSPPAWSSVLAVHGRCCAIVYHHPASIYSPHLMLYHARMRSSGSSAICSIIITTRIGLLILLFSWDVCWPIADHHPASLSPPTESSWHPHAIIPPSITQASLVFCTKLLMDAAGYSHSPPFSIINLIHHHHHHHHHYHHHRHQSLNG